MGRCAEILGSDVMIYLETSGAIVRPKTATARRVWSSKASVVLAAEEAGVAHVQPRVQAPAPAPDQNPSHPHAHSTQSGHHHQYLPCLCLTMREWDLRIIQCLTI